MESKIVDSFSAKGYVHIKKIDKRTMEVVEEIDNHNLIVKSGRSTLINLLIGNSALKITKMAIGKGGANLSTSPFVPIAPTDGNTNLASPILTSGLATISPNLTGTNPQVTFTALFDCLDVKSLVNEVGLFFNDGTTMFARYTFKTVSLETDSNFSLQVSWTIEF